MFGYKGVRSCSAVTVEGFHGRCGSSETAEGTLVGAAREKLLGCNFEQPLSSVAAGT